MKINFKDIFTKAKAIDLGAIINTVASVVSSIEILFAGSRGAGRRKRVHALRRIARDLNVDGIDDLAPSIVGLVDLLGKFAGDTDVVERIVNIYGLISKPTQTLADAVAGDAEAREELIELVADAIDIESLSDGIEWFGAQALVDLVIAEAL